MKKELKQKLGECYSISTKNGTLPVVGEGMKKLLVIILLIMISRKGNSISILSHREVLFGYERTYST